MKLSPLLSPNPYNEFRFDKGNVAEEDAGKEGSYTAEEFRKAWEEIYGW